MSSAPQRTDLPHLAAAADPWSQLTDAERLLASQRRELIAAWRRQCADFAAAGGTKREATRLFLAVHPELSRARLYRWIRAAATGDPFDLLDGRRLNRGAEPEPVCPQLWQRFQSFWLTIQQRTVALCWQIVAAEYDEHRQSCPHGDACRWPGLRVIQAKVRKELPPIVSDYRRFGDLEWSRRWGLKNRRDYSQYRSNQLWSGDFHEFDVFCRKSDADWTIVRPLLSSFLDLRSRFCPAWHVCLHENQDTVLLAFRKGVESVGPPQHAVIDNGWSYKARGVTGSRPGKRRIVDEDYARSVFGALGVEVHFSIHRNPDSKPIERWHRTIEEQFGALHASYCGGDNKNPRFKAACKLSEEHPEQCPTVAEFSAAFGQWLEGIYHATPHTGDGMGGYSPLCAFEKFDPIPRVILPEGLLDLLLMRCTKPVKVTRYGVRYNSIEYGAGDPRLFLMQGQEVLLRIHPEDASYVVVCDQEGKPICRAINNQFALTGVNNENVADGMRAKAKAKRLIRSMSEGGAKPASQSVTEAAISARLKAGQAAESAERARATGTEDAAPARNMRPLKSGWAKSVESYRMQIDPPIEVPRPLTELPDFDDDDDDGGLEPLKPEFEPDDDGEPEFPDWEDDDDP